MVLQRFSEVLSNEQTLHLHLKAIALAKDSIQVDHLLKLNMYLLIVQSSLHLAALRALFAKKTPSLIFHLHNADFAGLIIHNANNK